jgi:hypothetical protein
MENRIVTDLECNCECHDLYAGAPGTVCIHCSWEQLDPIGQVYSIEYKWREHKENPCIHRMADMVDLLQKIKESARG